MNVKAQKRNTEWLLESGLEDANFWETIADCKVKCRLCPRKCHILPGRFGFCQTRYNQNGMLKTAIWGKMLTPSIEPIETEAVFHFWPGAKILSLGNLGCNLECDFCQNWESSNMKNLSEDFVKYYEPHEIINLARSMGVKIISFTYNDPVIWFEYVYATAKLAHEHGMKTLFKSAGFISPEAAKYLTKVIDIFSISLKSSNAATFKSMSKGNLNSVLKAIKIFFKSGKHLEISNLVIPGLTDNEEDIKVLIRWVKNELSDEIPLHFVRFHPAYRYNEVDRTSIDLLNKARQIAFVEGMKNVYIGNTYEEKHADIYCKNCDSLLIHRFGLYTEIGPISPEGICLNCGQDQKIKLEPVNKGRTEIEISTKFENSRLWEWLNTDTRNLHVKVKNTSDKNGSLVCEHVDKKGSILDREVTCFPGKAEVRMTIGQKNKEATEVAISSSPSLQFSVVELMDRAHFPLEK